MDDTRCRRFFSKPTETLQRRYEALRAFFVDQLSYQDIAQRFGVSYHTVRSWVRDFRAQQRAKEVPPFFSNPSAADLQAATPPSQRLNPNQLSSPTVAN
jgi:transposase-like protein